MVKLLTLGTLGLTLFALPLFSFAQSASCPVLTRTLTFGSQGEDVRQLQRFLTNEGELLSDYATGNFGPLTQEAVRNWQWSKRIITSREDAGLGIVGPKTRAAVNAICKVSSPTRSVSLGAPSSAPSSTTSLKTPPSTVSSVATAPKCISRAPKTVCATSWQGRRGRDGCVASWYCISMSSRNSISYAFSTSSPATSTTASIDATPTSTVTTENGGNVGGQFGTWCPNGNGGLGYWSLAACPTADTSPDFTYGSSANVQAGSLCAPEGRQEFIACPYMANCLQGGTYLICRNALWTPF